MEALKVQLLETLVIGLVYALALWATRTLINSTLRKAQLEKARRRIIIRSMHLFTTIGALVLVAGVWGLEQHEIAVFASSILTALGIAFFAQWSILSNITSSIILFFNHPLKLGDTVKVMDKDCPFEGEVIELTYFFVHLRTRTGETITIPNAQLLQKSVSVMERPEQK